MANERTEEALTEAIIDLFISIIGFIPREKVTADTNFMHDFAITDDDLTCFMMQVKWQYKLTLTTSDWERIETIAEVVELVGRKR